MKSVGSLFSLLAFPWIVGKGRRYHEWQAVGLFLGLFAVTFWLIAPIGVWQVFGINWTLLWLIPTAGVVCAIGWARGSAGEG